MLKNKFFLIWNDLRIFIFFISLIFFTSCFSQIPCTFSISNKKLAKSKLKIENGDSLFLIGLTDLINSAEDALENGPYSVTFKKILPFGASKHDYVSLSRYWWPNPSNADGLPYVRIDGKTNPEREMIPDYRMMNNMASDVFTLGLAYYFTEDERYAQHAKYLIGVFFFDNKTKMNPNFEFSQIVKGKPISGGATISATSLIPMIEGVQLIKNSKFWSKRDQSKLQSWFKKFLEWMLSSEKGRFQSLAPNNIGTYYTLQTVVYALYIEDYELASKLISTQGFQRIYGQIEVDGKMPHELRRANPWNYVKFNLIAFDKLVEVAKKVNVDLLTYESENGSSIKKAVTWLFPFAYGSKVFEFNGNEVSRSSIISLLNEIKSIPHPFDCHTNYHDYKMYFY